MSDTSPTIVDRDRLRRSLTNITPNPEAIMKIEALRDSAKSFGDDLTAIVPAGRERSTAVTKLEEAVMWAVKAIALASD